MKIIITTVVETSRRKLYIPSASSTTASVPASAPFQHPHHRPTRSVRHGVFRSCLQQMVSSRGPLIVLQHGQVYRSCGGRAIIVVVAILILPSSLHVSRQPGRVPVQGSAEEHPALCESAVCDHHRLERLGQDWRRSHRRARQFRTPAVQGYRGVLARADPKLDRNVLVWFRVTLRGHFAMDAAQVVVPQR